MLRMRGKGDHQEDDGQERDEGQNRDEESESEKRVRDRQEAKIKPFSCLRIRTDGNDWRLKCLRHLQRMHWQAMMAGSKTCSLPAATRLPANESSPSF